MQMDVSSLIHYIFSVCRLNRACVKYGLAIRRRMMAHVEMVVRQLLTQIRKNAIHVRTAMIDAHCNLRPIALDGMYTAL